MMQRLKNLFHRFDGKKTLIYAAINLGLSLVPQSREWMMENPEAALQLNAAIIAGLRALTSTPILKK